MKIAIYTICKNEEKHVDEWLHNVADADCICVADTGSTDRTMLNFNHGSWWYLHVEPIHIQPFRFDVARNAAMALVPPDVDVCISLDLDERLEPHWRQIVEDNWRPDTCRWDVMYRRAGIQGFFHNSRVHARNGYYWREPCHEGLYPWMREDRIEKMPSFKITHYPDETKSRSQYAELLAWGVHEEPWNLRRIFYYAREMLMQHNYETARDWFSKYLEIYDGAGMPETEESEKARAFLAVSLGAID